MKKFILGLLSGIILSSILAPILFLAGQRIFKIIPSFCEDTSQANVETGTCSNINPEVKEYGNLKVNLLYQGSPAKKVEVDLALVPGPENYCYQITDDKGIVNFKKVPVGKYVVYLNMTNFPEEYGIPSAEVSVEITANQTTEQTIELTDYQ